MVSFNIRKYKTITINVVLKNDLRIVLATTNGKVWGTWEHLLTPKPTFPFQDDRDKSSLSLHLCKLRVN